ncbi:hypothetical protein BRADI_2g33995v3 [Brachypodium distachyon]|uniref:Uncharacterized protein n=1 Tax=Brachypodium distachyon TaxID=15368 RepID=A0A0Q3R1A6_BRADI|nr:hypothetical protein BRADI_2g33995v3 [Brachypodium distachyon]
MAMAMAACTPPRELRQQEVGSVGRPAAGHARRQEARRVRAEARAMQPEIGCAGAEAGTDSRETAGGAPVDGASSHAGVLLVGKKAGGRRKSSRISPTYPQPDHVDPALRPNQPSRGLLLRLRRETHPPPRACSGLALASPPPSGAARRRPESTGSPARISRLPKPPRVGSRPRPPPLVVTALSSDGYAVPPPPSASPCRRAPGKHPDAPLRASECWAGRHLPQLRRRLHRRPGRGSKAAALRFASASRRCGR